MSEIHRRGVACFFFLYYTSDEVQRDFMSEKAKGSETDRECEQEK